MSFFLVLDNACCVLDTKQVAATVRMQTASPYRVGLDFSKVFSSQVLGFDLLKIVSITYSTKYLT